MTGDSRYCNELLELFFVETGFQFGADRNSGSMLQGAGPQGRHHVLAVLPCSSASSMALPTDSRLS